MIWSGFVAIVTMWVTSVITAEGVCLFESKCTMEGRRDRERETFMREGDRERERDFSEGGIASN